MWYVTIEPNNNITYFVRIRGNICTIYQPNNKQVIYVSNNEKYYEYEVPVVPSEFMYDEIYF